MNPNAVQSLMRIGLFLFWICLSLLALLWVAGSVTAQGASNPTVDLIRSLYQAGMPVLLGGLGLSAVLIVIAWVAEGLDPQWLHCNRRVVFGTVVGCAGLAMLIAGAALISSDRAALSRAADEQLRRDLYWGRHWGATEYQAFQVRQQIDERYPYRVLLVGTGVVLAGVGGLYAVVSWVVGHLVAQSQARKRFPSPTAAAPVEIPVEIIEAELVRPGTDATPRTPG